jgi:hypothetical protein
MQIGKSYKRTRATKKKTNGKANEIKRRSKNLMLTPQSKFIDIVATIRVPITIGQAEVLAMEH